MTSLLLLILAAQQPSYDTLTLERLAAGTRHTHVCTTGPVVYKRKQKDGDWHITLDNGKAKLVVEIVPKIPLTVPGKGDTILVCGVQRRDGDHKWVEIHPAYELTIVEKKQRKRK